MSKSTSANPTTYETDSEANQTKSESQSSSAINRFGQAKKTLTQATQSLTRNAERVGSGVKTVATDAVEYAHQNPAKALAIAIGSGLTIGYLVGAKTRRHSYWSTISSAVLSAIADRIR